MHDKENLSGFLQPQGALIDVIAEDDLENVKVADGFFHMQVLGQPKDASWLVFSFFVLTKLFVTW